jgi:hypothetical protein
VSLGRRLEALERTAGGEDRCRACGDRHCPDWVTLLAVARAGDAACCCACCGWVAELAATLPSSGGSAWA